MSGLAVGGGLGVFFGQRALDDGSAALKFANTGEPWIPFNAFLKISPDGDIACAVHRAEMGQGVSTALPMLLAEELDADWQRISFEFAPVDRDYFNFGIVSRGQPMGEPEGRFFVEAGNNMVRNVFHALGISMTIGSTSMVDAWDSVRPAGAAARMLLIQAAANEWDVAPSDLQTEAGFVINPATGARLGYGELANAAAELDPPGDIKLKPAEEYRLLGTSPARLDSPAKVTGEARFALDVSETDMLHGAVAFGPVAGGTLTDYQTNGVENSPGVHSIVQVGANAIAILADDSWTALQAAKQVSVNSAAETAERKRIDTDTLFDGYRNSLDSEPATLFVGEEETPDMEADLAVEYELPYLAHFCMEPMNASALVDNGKVTVWAPTQSLSRARDAAAEISGVEPANVNTIRTYMGGGFGRRAEQDFVKYAVTAAMTVPGRPVKLMYSREEDVRHDVFRPAALARMQAELDDDIGTISKLHLALATQSVLESNFVRNPNPRGADATNDETTVEGAANLIYGVPDYRIEYVAQISEVPVGYWRSTATSYTGFMLESFMDELATQTNSDPVEFRLAHLAGNPKHAEVLSAAAQLGNWGTNLPAGHGRGIALVEQAGSICAQVIEISMPAENSIRVERVSCVFDCGTVIHPDIVEAQLQSSIIDGLAAALHGRITVKDGVVQQSNFDSYRFLRIDEIPPIEIVLLPQGGRPGGVGEPSLPAVAPALTNAIYAASGRRLRSLPVDSHFEVL